jgi:hypothetical protein
VKAPKAHPVIKVSRRDAVKLIDRIRERAATDDSLRSLLYEFGIDALTPCDGDAHANPHIDNCHRCAPRWAFTGRDIRIP